MDMNSTLKVYMYSGDLYIHIYIYIYLVCVCVCVCLSVCVCVCVYIYIYIYIIISLYPPHPTRPYFLLTSVSSENRISRDPRDPVQLYLP